MSRTLFVDDFAPIPSRVVNERWSGFLSSTGFRFMNGDRLCDTSSSILMPDGTRERMSTVIADWLSSHGAKKHPVKARQRDRMELLPPVYATPGESSTDDWVYMDIEAAYPSVYSRLRWSDEYIPGTWSRRGMGRAMNDFPFPSHKLARNAVIGIARGGKVRKYIDGELVEIRSFTSLQNLHLICIIMTVMHDIAATAKGMGCPYWNTDGGVVSTDVAYKLKAYARDEWGLNLRAKYKGRAVVRGVGDYSVGDRHKGLGNRIFYNRYYRLTPVSNKERDRVKFLLDA